MGCSTVGMVLDSKIAKSTFSPPSELICHPHGHNPIPTRPLPFTANRPTVHLLSFCRGMVGSRPAADEVIGYTHYPCYTQLPRVWARPIRAGRHQVSH